MKDHGTSDTHSLDKLHNRFQLPDGTFGQCCCFPTSLDQGPQGTAIDAAPRPTERRFRDQQINQRVGVVLCARKNGINARGELEFCNFGILPKAKKSSLLEEIVAQFLSRKKRKNPHHKILNGRKEGVVLILGYIAVN